MTGKKEYIVAIDLGSSNVTIVVGDVDNDGRITLIDQEVRPSYGVSKGEIKNLEQVAQAVKEAVVEIEGRLGIKITEAYSGISGFHIQCVKHPYYVYVSGADGEICDDDVRRLNESMRSVQAPDGHRILHISPQHYVVNGEEAVHNPVGMFGKTLESTFNLVIGDNSITSRVEKALAKVGITLKGLYINPLVSAEAVVLPDEKEMGVAIIDIGAGVTDICIFHDKIMRYVGVIPMGAETINRDIRAYGILERHVEELKMSFGCAVPEKVDKEKTIKVPGRTPRDPKSISFVNLASIIEARLKDIADYVMAEIKNAGYEGKLGAGIVITGGCAGLANIDEMMEKYIGLDVRVAAPQVFLTDDSKVDDFRLATAVGILINGAKDGGCDVGTGVITVKTVAPTPTTPKSEPETSQSENSVEQTPVEPIVVKKKKRDEGEDTEEKKSKLMGWIRHKVDDLFNYNDDIIDDDKR